MMEVTSKEVLDHLRSSGRHRFTERQLTDFRCKQLLPPLQRFKQPGSRKPIYLWDESVIPQAAYLHDVLQWDRQHDRLYLPLWLEGYNIPLRATRRLLLRFIERHLSQLTQGKTDLEEILDHVSELIYENWLPRWKYSPKKHEMIRSMGVEAWAELVECLFDFLATPLYEPDPEILINLFLNIARCSKEYSPDTYTDQKKLFQFGTDCQKLVKRFSPLFSIPQLKEAIEQATPEEWIQARHYYQELRKTTDFVLTELNTCINEPFPEIFFYRLKMNGALYLLPPLLSLIRHGYSYLLEQGTRYLHFFIEVLKQHGWTTRHPKEVMLDIIQRYDLDKITEIKKSK